MDPVISKTYTTLHAFTAPAPNMASYAIFGKILPLPETGLPWLLAALFVFLVTGIAYRRVPDGARTALFASGVLLTYIGTYILSARWLDDVFINLIHPYNLLHHGMFSTRLDSMTNGTVEILYYGLLTPFAGDRTLLIRTNYVTGALIGIGHLLALSYLLRRQPVLIRFFVLAVFAGWIPVVQSFSSGYGNGVVTLLWLLGVIAVLENKPRHLAIYCALMPLFRPDAILYSASLAVLYSLVHRRFAVRYWIPALLAPVIYTVLVHQMYHQWVPTPVLFKRVSVEQIYHTAFDAIPDLVVDYFLGSLEHAVLLAFALIYLILPRFREVCLGKRTLTCLLAITTPILVFFYTTGWIGYNPTNYRYYAIFDIALFLAGISGFVSLLYRIAESFARPIDSGLPRKRMDWYRAAAFLPALFLLISSTNINGSIHAAKDGNWEGRDVGIASTFYDVRRMSDLRFAGEYFGASIPADWEIASTEMDTFGFFNGRQILDLWGFSNQDIATSSERTPDGLRRNSRIFLESNVPVFWVRTLSNTSKEYKNFGPWLRSDDPMQFAASVVCFPNLSRRMMQAGPPREALQKYDVVRVLHGTTHISILLVRKDLAPRLCDALVKGGATSAGEMRLPLPR